jgi:uncharacterized protein YrrD
MQKVTNIKGLEIVTVNEQQYIGVVADVLIDTFFDSIKGFIITDGKNLFNKNFVPFFNIKFILHNFIFIEDMPEIMKVNSLTKRIKNLKRFESTKKLSVTSRKGRYLGKPIDLLFDPVTGNIKALVLTNNVILLIRSCEIIFGSRNIIVKSIRIEKDLTQQRKNKYFK